MNRLILFFSTSALANGAMGIGLEHWELPIWFTYVIAMTVFEAWFIGKWLGMGAAASIGTSIIGNVLTGVFCGVGGLLAPLFHGTTAGSSLNPNPLLHTVIILAVFALPSALLETFIWRGMCKWLSESDKGGKAYAASFAAHAIGIPLGLIILLFPARPYTRVEGMATTQRRWFVSYDVKSELESYISETGRIPDVKDIAGLLRILSIDRPDAKAAFYLPIYQRFDTGETYRGAKWQWNASLAGKKLNDNHFGEPEWLIRSPDASRSLQLTIDLATGQVDVVRR